MRTPLIQLFRLILFSLAIALIVPTVAYLNTDINRSHRFGIQVLLASSNLRIKEQNPVVNEGKQITLTAVDANGQPVTDVTWESGSPEVASVNSQQGVVTGTQRGFSTI